MEKFRIANFIMQSVYLTAHFFFIVKQIKQRQPTPIWTYFTLFSVAAWLWVSGRFMETIVYLFLPTDNAAYVFAANFQYIGNTTAACAYLIWNLYLAGKYRLAENVGFRAALFSIPVGISTLVFTNPYHRLIYTYLVMGEKVRHGVLFMPCFVAIYLIIFIGYFISIFHIIRSKEDLGKRLVMFSLFPILPLIAVAVRSISGVDRLDYTPIIMAVTLACLYMIVFKYNYVSMIPLSIDTAIEQDDTPIFLYDRKRETLLYSNQAAKGKYARALQECLPQLTAGEASFETNADGTYLRIETKPLRDADVRLCVVADLSELIEQQALLEKDIAEQRSLIQGLEEKKRNINAYLESLDRIADLKEKQELLASTQKDVTAAFNQIEANLRLADEDVLHASSPLSENIHISQQIIATIRKTVSQLREV